MVSFSFTHFVPQGVHASGEPCSGERDQFRLVQAEPVAKASTTQGLQLSNSQLETWAAAAALSYSQGRFHEITARVVGGRITQNQGSNQSRNSQDLMGKLFCGRQAELKILTSKPTKSCSALWTAWKRLMILSSIGRRSFSYTYDVLVFFFVSLRYISPERAARLVRIMTTRCMNEALYFCTGREEQADWKHFGLASWLKKAIYINKRQKQH